MQLTYKICHVSLAIAFLICFMISFATASPVEKSSTGSKVVYTMHEIIDIFQGIGFNAGLSSQDMASIFLPLRNYLQSERIGKGHSVTLYPQAIQKFIAEKLRSGQAPPSIGYDLLYMFQRGGFYEEHRLDKNEEVFVFGVSKRAERLEEAPATVHVIQGDELERRGYLDLEAVFHDLPAFDISRANSLYYASIYQRGYRSNHNDRTLLLIDGVEDNDIWSGHAEISRQYPLNHIKTIEVVYGPAADMYGANAFTGAVHIITKDPEDMITEENSIGIYTQMNYGKWNTRYLDATFAAKYRDLSFFLTGRFYKSDEMDLSTYPDWDYKPYSPQNPAYMRNLTIAGTNENGEYLAEMYRDTLAHYLNDLNHPYYDMIRDEHGRLIKIKPTAAGLQKAAELDEKALRHLKYTDHTDDYCIYGKFKLDQVTVGFQMWQCDEGGLAGVTDKYYAGIKNGNRWILKHDLFYANYETDFSDRLSLFMSGRFKSHEYSNYTAISPLSTYYNGRLELKNLVLDQPADWHRLYYFQISKQLRGEVKLLYNLPFVEEWKGTRFSLVSGAEFRNSLIQGDFMTSDQPNPQEMGRHPDIAGGNHFSTWDFGFYTQASYNPYHYLRLVLGGRLDHNRVRDHLGYGTIYNSRAAIIYTPSFGQGRGFVLKGIYSEAFKDADNLVKYTTDDVRQVANPDLKPEQVQNYEISIGFSPLRERKDLFLELVGYYTSYYDVGGIGKTILSDGRKVNQFQNIGALRIQGVQFKSTLTRGNIDFFGNYTYTDPFDTNKDVRIGDIAEHQVNVGVNARLTPFGKRVGLFNFNYRVNYVGNRRTGEGTSIDTNPYQQIDGYVVMSGAISYQPNLFSPFVSNWRLQLIMNNILDEEYYDPGIRSGTELYASRVPQRGRHLMIRWIYDF